MRLPLLGPALGLQFIRLAASAPMEQYPLLSTPVLSGQNEGHKALSEGRKLHGRFLHITGGLALAPLHRC